MSQKARTREALISATRRLLAEGTTPTVEEAAATADVSRATAYRYFPNQRALLVAAHPEIDSPSMLPDDPPEDPEARLDAVIDELTRLIIETEPELRTALRLSLEPQSTEDEGPVLRQGRAIAWIDDALAPLRDRMPKGELRRLVLAVRSAVGIEAHVWLTDVAGLSREESAEVMRWSARALLRSALAEEGGEPQALKAY